MKLIFGLFLVFSLTDITADKCGCKAMNACYLQMLDALHEQDEAYCIEDAALGTSTVTMFLKALQSFCGQTINVITEDMTHDTRNLYEVIIHDVSEQPERDVPTIIIDAGQEAGVDSVRFALFVIQHLVACQENKEMIDNVKWVIMPNTNPDGMEYSRYTKNDWRKNLKMADDKNSFGVDVSRNFDENWGACPKNERGFAPDYPGPFAGSENETIFIKKVLNKHKTNAKVYLSIRRDGHHIGFPFAFTENPAPNRDQLEFVAGEIASKVNIRSGGISTFKNDSICKLEGKERCGHSVEYAQAIGIKLCFEMRTFLESDSFITSMFQTMPRGYDTTLRNGYLTAIREFYTVLTNQKKYGHLWKK